jgi:hypothetical protein
LKAEIGNMSATILSVTDRPAYASQTAKQTSTLQTPLKNSVTKSGCQYRQPNATIIYVEMM